MIGPNIQMKGNIRMLLRETLMRGETGLLGSEIVPRYRSVGFICPVGSWRTIFLHTVEAGKDLEKILIFEAWDIPGWEIFCK